MNNDKKIAQAWIDNYESGEDEFRVKYLEPYLKEIIRAQNKNAKILDVGCGWGTALAFISSTQEYYGIDKNKHFFPYLKKKYKELDLNLKHGSLPEKVNVPDEYFDLTICSMVLLDVQNFIDAIDILFAKTKSHGKVIIIDFNDEAEKVVKKDFFEEVEVNEEGYIKGTTVLPSGLKFKHDIFFHKEKKFEKCINKHGKFIKNYLGPLFVAYEIIKF